jgi:hypothetical protein
MHAKMDHAKTASPMFLHKTKQLDGLMKLHVSVTACWHMVMEMFAMPIMA